MEFLKLTDNKQMRMTRIEIYIAIISALILASCTPKESDGEMIYHFNSGEIFHTSYHIKYEYGRSLEEEILAELDRFEYSLNPFKENTIITKVNRNEPVELDSFFIDVFSKAMEVSRATGGKFDITASPLINAWGFGFKNMDSVTPQMIDSLKEFVGYEKIFIDANGQIQKTDPRVEINPSAISKGYSCDVVARLFDSFGIKNYMVEIGGEIVARGINDKGECWRIGIDKPINDNSGMSHDLQEVLSLCDKALATSGNYRNYYLKDGKMYAHTIDPQTGYPSEQDLLSVTVIADDCMTADAYATAFMATGMEKSKEIAESIPGLYYYFFYAKPDNGIGISYSEGFEQFFVDKNRQLDE